MLLRSVGNKEALDSRVVIGLDCHTPNTVKGEGDVGKQWQNNNIREAE